MTDIFLTFLRCVILGGPFVSAIVFIWWFLDFNRDGEYPDLYRGLGDAAPIRDRFAERHKGIRNVVFIGAFWFLLCVLATGIEDFLWFIPSGWGEYDEDGYFSSTRGHVAFWLALLLSIFFAHVFCRSAKIRAEKQKLTIVARMRREDAFRYRSLMEEQDETQTILADLRDRLYNRSPLADEEQLAGHVLEEHLEKLEHLIWRNRETDANDE